MTSLKRHLKRARDHLHTLDRFRRERPSAFTARTMAVMLALLLGGWGVWWMLSPPELSLTKFMNEIAAKHVQSAEIMTYNIDYRIYAMIEGKEFYIKAPISSIDQSAGKDGVNIVQTLKANRVDLKFIDGYLETFALTMTLVSPVLVIALMIGMAIAMAKDSTTSWMTIIRSVPTRFKDVAGAEEAKYELAEILAYLKKEKAAVASKARTPRGALMAGPPGTGKTLLAKALAGEAETSFIAVSGSDFHSMWFGGSARRVRALFRYARQNKPCVVFIDEFDAIGAKRAENSDPISKETNGTLNQLLVEMDGFGSNDGVFILAATNLPEHLDPAVKRAGRMDRRIEVGLPDLKGREAIFKVHAAPHALGGDVDLMTVARGVPGFSGADIENLVNEAAIFAVRRGSETVDAADFESAKNKVIMGVERKSLVLSEEERRLTAYHEAGHALVACSVEHSDPVHKATIVPHGRALGMVVRLPERDSVSMSLAKLQDNLAVVMAGRAAEKIKFGEELVTTGAESDIEAATSYASRMVLDWGFSKKIGMVKVTKERAIYDQAVSDEIRGIVDSAFVRASDLIARNPAALEALAAGLLENESLSGEEIRAIVNDGRKAQAA